jgi:urease accessory protein
MSSKSSIATMPSEKYVSKSYGMAGFLNLELGYNNSKTVISNLEVKPPLLVQKAMYLDPMNPEFAHIYIMSSAGGILQGDTLKIDIKATTNSTACVTTQAATKVYKSETQSAFQNIDLTTQRQSYLEFLPKQIIPHKSADFFQEANLRISNNSVMLYSETISCGRIAHGEKFDFNSLIFRTNAYDEEGRILFSEGINMQPQKRKKDFQNLFEDKNLYSTIFIISPETDCEKLDADIHSELKPESLSDCSQLPNNSGIVVRVLANTIAEVDDVISIIRKNSRLHYLSAQK